MKGENSLLFKRLRQLNTVHRIILTGVNPFIDLVLCGTDSI